MEAFEFETVHENGKITIPDEFRHNLTKKLKIIILTQEEKEKETALIKLLLDAPTWNESYITEFYKEIREGYANWKIDEF